MQQFNGNAAYVVPPAALSIASSTNTSPIQVVTTAAHGLMTGDTVSIFGHQVNTSLNGESTVHVINATSFSLDGSVGVGVGGPTGTVHVLTFGSTYGQPSDGDDNSGANLNTPTGALGDRTAALLVATGAYKLVDVASLNNTGTTLNTSAATIAVPGSSTFVASSLGSIPFFLNVHGGDRIDYQVNCSARATTASAVFGLRMYASNVVPGGSPSFARIEGGATWHQANANQVYPISFGGHATFVTTGEVALSLYGASGGAADTITLVDDLVILARLWRPTFLFLQ